MLRLMIAAAVLAAPLFAAEAARAQDDWAAQLAGLDGVTIACANSNRERYAADICDEMAEKLMAEFAGADIPAADLGAWYTHEEAEPEKPAAMARPLKLTVFVRGSDSANIHAISVRTRLSVEFENAVEAGSDEAGRSGELLLWEDATTGAGPLKPLAGAIAGAAHGKMADTLAAVIAAWPRN